MKRIKVKKGQILQQIGDLNTKGYQVESGLLRSYSIDEKGKEHIFMFAPEGWMVSDNVPRTEPSELCIDVLEDAVLLQVEKNFDIEINISKLVKRMAVLQKRIIMLMSASAIERYEHFIETYPDIVQRVPQRMIASYLGITPEALSKVKRERLSKK
ncbi:MAG: Crp/Fnr family transcriptional regulator [Aureispira sp.]|nr:Crp/Fnr family transcriptional regulator [Aureispira sp.]